MSPSGTVRVANLWKRFRADRPPRRLLDLLEHLPDRLDRSRVQRERWRWALRDVSVAIAPGESVGLIGTNGSGKSTLLKIVNQIMYPYAGTVDVVGRIGALIDVRSGIHPQLTGRENVQMLGALLGLSRTEVLARFDEIVGFAQVEQAVDRQVKFYSSGMQMRLGFAVAAFLEPDVLLVDEVLAVGDTAFQQRCLDKMRSVHQGGATLVFVSHDLNAVEAACARTIWLDHGVVARDGPTPSVLAAYRASVEATARAEMPATGPVRVADCSVVEPGGGIPRTHGALDVRLVIESEAPRFVQVYLGITESVPSPVFVVERELALDPGPNEVRCRVQRVPLPRGRFAVWIAVRDEAGRDLVPWRPAAEFEMVGPSLADSPGGVSRAAPVVVDATWETASR